MHTRKANKLFFIHSHKNFLTEEECQKLIDSGEGKWEEAKVYGGAKGVRTAECIWLKNNTKLSKDIRQRVAKLFSIDIKNMERLHVIKYQPGGEYKPHHDHRNEENPRVKSILIYLNDDYLGGETYFPNVQRKVKPETGRLIAWDNLMIDGEPDKDSMHAGLPIKDGIKYIATIWVRDKTVKK